jgi:hypothetical protein
VFDSPNYPADQDAADKFVAEMRHGTLVACSPGEYPQVSILPFVRTGDRIELHCVQADPTFGAVRANPRVTFFVSDFLAWSPHDWVSARDAGQATLHFRAVAFECDAEFVSTDPADVAAALGRLVRAYEPEGTYEPIEVGEFYGSRFEQLATIRLRIVNSHIKMKTGPSRSAGIKQRLAHRLRERAHAGDARAAEVIEASIPGRGQP